jgi:hypothetical protein
MRMLGDPSSMSSIRFAAEMVTLPVQGAAPPAPELEAEELVELVELDADEVDEVDEVDELDVETLEVVEVEGPLLDVPPPPASFTRPPSSKPRIC